MITIREATQDDARSLSHFIKNLDKESQFLLYNPGERNDDVGLIKAYLDKSNQRTRSIMFISVNDSHDIVGFICGESSNLQRLSHVMKVNIGVLKKYRKYGLGRQLTATILSHAKQVGITRVEATIINANKPSLNLCKKFGFEIEGIKRKSIKISDHYFNEYLMSKLI